MRCESLKNLSSSRLILTNLDTIYFLIHFKELIDPIYSVEFMIKVVGNGVNDGICKTGDTLHVIREYDNADGGLLYVRKYCLILVTCRRLLIITEFCV
jgi:hypothetical protein